MSMKEKLTIGKLAKRTDINVETIRYYEKKELLKQPNLKIGSYRIYPEKYIEKILFIKKVQNLGFSLKEIKELLYLDEDEKTICNDLSTIARKKIDEVQEKIDSLKKMKKKLSEIEKNCKSSKNIFCKISDCFENKC